jgi:hypothetical protein
MSFPRLTATNVATAKATFMRTADAAFQHFALLSEANHMLGDLFDAVNTLSSTAWRVNQNVCPPSPVAYKEAVNPPHH